VGNQDALSDAVQGARGAACSDCCALAASHAGTVETLNLSPLARWVVGLFAGLGIGVVAALMGVAGGELLIPTI